MSNNTGRIIMYQIDGAILIRLGRYAHQRQYELIITPDKSHTLFAESDTEAKSYAKDILRQWRSDNETT